MPGNHGDILIHVHENLNDDRLHQLEDTLRQKQCVFNVETTPENEHLFVVTLDSDCTDSTTVLQAVRDQGFHADIVGL